MKKIGRPLCVNQIKKVKAYRNKGLSFRQIAKLLNADVKTVFRWSNYTLA